MNKSVEKMEINGEPILYIEYIDDIPCFVVTTYSVWNCELDASGDLLMFNSGNGKNYKEQDGRKKIEIEGNLAFPGKFSFKLWVNEQYYTEYKNMDGVEIIKNPISYKGNINPYINSWEVYMLIYCEECKAWYDEWGCLEHPEESEE